MRPLFLRRLAGLPGGHGFFRRLPRHRASGTLTVIPRKKGQHWELGSVTLNRVRWYNAAPVALAAVLIIVIALAVAWWRTAPGWSFQLIDLPIAFALAPQSLSFWPSRVDWCIAVRSWPWLVIITPFAWLAWRYQW